jgi:hypothetical protein
MRKSPPLIAAISAAIIGCAPPAGISAAEAEMHHHGDAAPACADPGLACATVATPLFAQDGSLWLVWGAAGQVSVARSADLGRSFAAPIRITPQPVRLDAGGDGRPMLAQGSNGRLVVAYARFKDDLWNAEALVSVSKDGGASFSAPHPITDDAAGQRFPVLASDGRGRIFAAWIDKRTTAAARAAGQPKPGAALAYAWSGDGGDHFDVSQVFQDNSCECCRLGVAMDSRGLPAVLFRNLFDGGVRDHALIVFGNRSSPGPASRVSEDNWVLNGCPHQGPSLAIGSGGTYHAAWFTLGPVRQGAFYARSTDGGRTFSPPLALGSADRHPTRPYVLVADGIVWLAWKEFDGQRTSVAVMRSHDDGNSWSMPRTIAKTDGDSDHPLLVSDGRHVFLSWLTHAEGYRLLPVDDDR